MTGMEGKGGQKREVRHRGDLGQSSQNGRGARELKRNGKQGEFGAAFEEKEGKGKSRRIGKINLGQRSQKRKKKGGQKRKGRQGILGGKVRRTG